MASIAFGGCSMKRSLKVVVTLALIAFLLANVDWTQGRLLAQKLTWSTVAVVLLAMCTELAISVWKWSRALVMHGLRYPYGYLFRAVCTGFFLNNFLPTSIGGDAYRVYRTLPSDGYRSRAVSAILVDRATGIGVLLTLGAIGAASLFTTSAIGRAYLSIYFSAVVAGFAVMFALYSGWLRPLTRRLRGHAAFDALAHNVTLLRRAGPAWVQQISLSAVFQLISVSIVYWLFHRISADVSFAKCALMTAAAGFAAFLPLSINGIGLMEGSFVAMAVALGVDYDQALLVAIIRRLMIAFLSLLCGVVYLLEGRPKIPHSGQPVAPGA